MEIELKFRFTQASFQKFRSFLMQSHGEIRPIFFMSQNRQSNYFFDSSAMELEGRRVNFRLRRVVKWTEFVDIQNRATTPSSPCINQSYITIKGLGDKGGTLKEGVSKINELECLIDNDIFDDIVESSGSTLRKYAEKIELVKLFTTLISPSADITLTGKFKNTRLVFKMNVGKQLGDDEESFLKLELDETEYDFGTAYELEVETSRPEKAKILLEDLFRDNGIEFTYSKRSKFGNLKAGSII